MLADNGQISRMGSRGGAETRRSEIDFSRKDAKAQRGRACGEAALSKIRLGKTQGCIDSIGLRPALLLCAFASLREKSISLLRVSAPPREPILLTWPLSASITIAPIPPHGPNRCDGHHRGQDKLPPCPVRPQCHLYLLPDKKADETADQQVEHYD